MIKEIKFYNFITDEDKSPAFSFQLIDTDDEPLKLNTSLSETSMYVANGALVLIEAYRRGNGENNNTYHYNSHTTLSSGIFNNTRHTDNGGFFIHYETYKEDKTKPYVIVKFKNPIISKKLQICARPGTYRGVYATGNASNHYTLECDIDITIDSGKVFKYHFISNTTERNVLEDIDILETDCETFYHLTKEFKTDETNNFKNISHINRINIVAYQPENTTIKVLISKDSHNTYYKYNKELESWTVVDKANIETEGNDVTDFSPLFDTDFSGLITEPCNLDFLFFLGTNDNKITPQVHKINIQSMSNE